MKEKIEQRIVGLFVLMVAILAYIAYSAVNTINESIKSNDWVNKTHALIVEANAILSYLHAGDSALRTYLMTGDPRDQGAYRVAYSEMKQHLTLAQALSKNGEEGSLQAPQLHELELLISNRIDFTRAAVVARNQGGLEAATKYLASQSDVVAMARIEGLVQNVNNQENSLLKDRDEQSHLSAQSTRNIVYTGVAANVILLGVVIWLLMDDLKARRRVREILEDANATLEAKVQERTAELVKANATLKQENLERKWAAQALDHQLRYSALIINSINELVFVISRALNISRINPAVSQLGGWEPQDLIAQPLDRVLPLTTKEGNEEQNPIIAAMRQGREIQDRECTMITKSGKQVAVRYSVFPLRDQDKVVGAVVTVRVPQGSTPK